MGEQQGPVTTPSWLVRDSFRILRSHVAPLHVEDVLGGGLFSPLYGSFWPADSLKELNAGGFGVDTTAVWRRELWAAWNSGLLPLA